MEDGREVGPLDAADPRFAGESGTAAGRPRRLVATRGPGASPEDPRVRRLRVLIPVAFWLVVGVVAAVFLLGLDPGDSVVLVGSEAEVRRAAGERPRRVCYREQAPCAWLTLVDGELLALNTSGPLGEEHGRQGVGWCPSSGHYGSNASGSRFDQMGNVVSGPAPRGLDRFGVLVDQQGRLRVDFSALTTGTQAGRAEPRPATGPACEQIPFDRAADLELEGT
jgi:hypothetical protein